MRILRLDHPRLVAAAARYLIYFHRITVVTGVLVFELYLAEGEQGGVVANWKSVRVPGCVLWPLLVGLPLEELIHNVLQLSDHLKKVFRWRVLQHTQGTLDTSLCDVVFPTLRRRRQAVCITP